MEQKTTLFLKKLSLRRLSNNYNSRIHGLLDSTGS
jgi:hypothetical protein